jgi:hypothetical protein
MEFKCALCNSTNLLKAEKESALIKNAHYTNCMDCGNVMILLNDTLIPTPTEDNEMTKAMIEDAAQAFKMNRGVSLQAVSLTEDKDMYVIPKSNIVTDAQLTLNDEYKKYQVHF